ncbi:MAG TPA: TRAP transporter substrate-binding protein [Burkholderiales bacterium]|jgi:C4-dicarboxylate-binding protein DctP|nr:TRAP transporter substrate-binding protein [Burkholderiales bacterium]
MTIPKICAAAALSGFTLLAQAQQFTMKLSTPTINDVTHEWMNLFKASVEKRAGGRIKVEVYPASQLGQIPRTVEGVALGTIEMTVPAVGFFIGLEPRFQVFDAPGLFDSVEHAQRVFSDPDVRKRLATFGATKGVEPLFTFANGPLMLLSHKPVRGIDDLKGQKIRVPGGAPLHLEPFRRLGASPVSMPLGEVMPSLSNRAIDGFIAAHVVLVAFKYYDVAKSATQLPGSFLIASGLVNRNFFKSLGALEPMVREEARKAEEIFAKGAVADVGRIRGAWEKNGGETIVLPSAEAKRYLDQATSVLPAILAANPQLKEDYEAIQAAAKKHWR